jgi:hypothetical protein
MGGCDFVARWWLESPRVGSPDVYAGESLISERRFAYIRSHVTSGALSPLGTRESMLPNISRFAVSPAKCLISTFTLTLVTQLPSYWFPQLHSSSLLLPFPGPLRN